MKVLPGGFLPFTWLHPAYKSMGIRELLADPLLWVKYIPACRERAEDTNLCFRKVGYTRELPSYHVWVVEFISVQSGWEIKFLLFTNKMLAGREETEESGNSWIRPAKGRTFCMLWSMPLLKGKCSKAPSGVGTTSRNQAHTRLHLGWARNSDFLGWGDAKTMPVPGLLQHWCSPYLQVDPAVALPGTTRSSP